MEPQGTRVRHAVALALHLTTSKEMTRGSRQSAANTTFAAVLLRIRRPTRGSLISKACQQAEEVSTAATSANTSIVLLQHTGHPAICTAVAVATTQEKTPLI